MQNLKQLATKLTVDITTVYRHYKRLTQEKGNKFTSHVQMRRGRIWLDGHAQYMIIKSFRHKHESFNAESLKLQCKIKETSLKSTIKALVQRSNNYAKTISDLNEHDIELNKQLNNQNTQLNEKQETIKKLLIELDHAQTIADNAQKSEKALDQKLITNKNSSGFLGWFKNLF